MTMRFQLLADNPNALPIVCKWYFDKWGREEEGSIELLTEDIGKKYLNSREIPLLILGIENEKVLAACQLKIREMKMFPQYEHWLGGGYIVPEHRGRGIAEKLITQAIRFAEANAVRTLYLQTEDLTGGLYKRLGWKPIETVQSNGVEVLVMKRSLL